MIRVVGSIAAFCMLLFGAAANAQYTVPESGWYWNPNIGGTGVNLEFQDTAMTLAYYAYTPTGNAVFYTVQGNYDVLNRRVVGDLYTFQGGQCIGCPYTAPTAVKIGTGTVQFSSLAKANVTFTTAAGSTTFAVQRFVFTLSYYPTESDQKKGLWTFTTFPSTGFPYGDALVVSGTMDGTGGVKQAVGTFYPSNRVLVGQPANVPGVNYLMLIDFSSTSYLLLFGEWTLGHFIGKYELYLKTGSPTFNGLGSVGSKIAGPATINQILSSAAGSGEILVDRLEEFAKGAKIISPLSEADHGRLSVGVMELENSLARQKTLGVSNLN